MKERRKIFNQKGKMVNDERGRRGRDEEEENVYKM